MGIGFAILSAVPKVHAQCITPTPLANGVVEAPVRCDADGNAGDNSTVGFDDQGRFIVARETLPDESGDFSNNIVVLRFAADGTAICCPATLAAPPGHHQVPSVAMSRDSRAVIGWLGSADIISTMVFTRLELLFDFDQDPFDFSPGVTPPSPGVDDHEVSVGIADAAVDREAFAWSNDNDFNPDAGLIYQATDNLAGVGFDVIRDCEPDPPGATPFCFVAETPQMPTAWQPAVSQRGDGITAAVWAEAELPTQQQSPFNIRLQLYDIDGDPIGDPMQTDKSILANDPGVERPDSTQKSPAVTLDDAGNLVVVWTALSLKGCTLAQRIFARRFFWDGNTSAAPVPLSGPFQVDNDPNASLTGVGVANINPTVALTRSTDPSICGSFIVAWNSQDFAPFPDTPIEIRAQYFGPTGQPIGAEFRVNQDTSPTGTVNRRRLANSAQHTISYGVDGRVITTWTAYDSDQHGEFPVGVYYTLLPSDYPQQLESTQGPSQLCIKADVNADGTADEGDIEPFVALLLAQPGTAAACVNVIESCRADTNCDGTVNGLDIQPFVDVLLGGPACTAGTSCGQAGASGGGGAPQPVMQDCDGDGVSDAEEIASGASADCNGDAYPDACNLALVIFTSYDCNNNGVPDECDIASCPPGEAWCADENGNGFLDACEQAVGLPVAAPGTAGSEEALVQFYDWSIARTWGPASGLTGAEQFQAVVVKLEELGLPIENPWQVE